jgi:predicted Zn finger-like uncharacterized protein
MPLSAATQAPPARRGRGLPENTGTNPTVLRAAGNNAIASDIMRLSCPQCQTEYEVPESALVGRPRTLRCADCGTKWKTPALPEVAEPADAEIAAGSDAALPEAIEPVIVEPDFDPAPDVAATPAPLSASRSAPAKPDPRKPNRGLGLSFLLVLLLIAIMLAEHRTIGHAWPPSLRLFNALGLH